MRFVYREVRPTSVPTPGGGSVYFDVQSILNEFRSWAFPCIHAAFFRFVPTFSTGAGGGVPRLTPQMFASNILIKDVGGQRINLGGGGPSLQVANRSVFGQSVFPPAATAVNQAGPVTFEQYFPIPIMPPKARRPRDYSIPVSTMLDGGEWQLTPGPATPVSTYYTQSAMDISLILKIVDEGSPELKSRFVVRDQAISQVDSSQYVMGGFMYSVALYNGKVNDLTAAPWTAGLLLDSTTLNFQQVRASALQNFHLLESQTFRRDAGTPATASPIVAEDPFFTGQAIPLIMPDRQQKIGELVNTSTLHVRFGGTVSSITTSDSPYMISTVLEERNPVASQRTLGRTDVAAAIMQSGRVKTANGNKKGVDQFPIALANVLPVKVGNGGKGA